MFTVSYVYTEPAPDEFGCPVPASCRGRQTFNTLNAAREYYQSLVDNPEYCFPDITDCDGNVIEGEDLSHLI